MPIPEQRDREQTRTALEAWLRSRRPDRPDLTVGPLGGPASSGFSNETIIFDAISTGPDGKLEIDGLVVRVKPTGYTVFMESWFDRQWFVMSTLAAHTDIPLPPMRWFEADPSVLGAPFYVMGKVPGQAASDQPPYMNEGWLFDATPEQQASAAWSGIEAMAKIHATPWRELGLGPIVEMPERGATGLDQQIAYYQESYDWAKAESGRDYPTVDAVWDWLLAHRPVSDRDALCWGDARMGNQLFDDWRVTAVLDWEMVCHGDPQMDLAWWLFLDDFHTAGAGGRRLPGLPSHEALVARWEELTGFSADHLHWFKVFAGFRFAVVMIRLITMFVKFEIAPADTDAFENNIVVHLAAGLLGLPAPGVLAPQA
jgi:aminoglycoside phosphotransferase (APT) family kinase protein